MQKEESSTTIVEIIRNWVVPILSLPFILLFIVLQYAFFLLLWPLRSKIQRGLIFPFLSTEYQFAFPVKEVSEPVFKEPLELSKIGETFDFRLLNEFPDLCWFWIQAGENETSGDYHEVFFANILMVFRLEDKVLYKRHIKLNFARLVGKKEMLFKCRIPEHLPLHTPIDFSVTIVDSDTSQARGPFYLIVYNSVGDSKGEAYFGLDGDPID